MSMPAQPLRDRVITTYLPILGLIALGALLAAYTSQGLT